MLENRESLCYNNMPRQGVSEKFMGMTDFDRTLKFFSAFGGSASGGHMQDEPVCSLVNPTDINK